MSQAKRVFRRPGLLAFLVVAFYMVLLTLQVRRGGETILGGVATAAFGPFLSLFDDAVRLSEEGLDAYAWQRDAALRAERLEVENRRLLIRIQLDRELERENRRLRELLQAPLPEGMDVVGGRALTRFGTPFARYMLVSVGRESGLKVDAPVLVPSGLVGRVVERVGALFKVRLITDPNSAVGVKSDRLGVRGVAVGAGNHLTVRWISNQADVRPGDLFVTSGEDGYFPPGIRVCVVTEAKNGNDYLKAISAQPLSESGKTGWVLLLRRRHAD